MNRQFFLSASITVMAALPACLEPPTAEISTTEQDSAVPPPGDPCQESHWTTTASSTVRVNVARHTGFNILCQAVTCYDYQQCTQTDSWGHNIVCPADAEITYLLSSTRTCPPAGVAIETDCPSPFFYSCS